jgi:hypothetical protein
VNYQTFSMCALDGPLDSCHLHEEWGAPSMVPDYSGENWTSTPPNAGNAFVDPSSLWQKSWQAEARPTWCRKQLIHRGGAGAFACEPGGMGLLPQAASVEPGAPTWWDVDASSNSTGTPGSPGVVRRRNGPVQASVDQSQCRTTHARRTHPSKLVYRKPYCRFWPKGSDRQSTILH